MGLDFIRKAAKSFKKGLDESRIELGTPTLFASEPASSPRTYVARISDEVVLVSGEELGARRLGTGKIVLMRGMDVVGELQAPPSELVEALQKSHNEACGSVVEVHDVANTAEIALC
ncbi:MAG: hypothetical protein OXK76_05975 [Gammaproteobacteria bacterium]|nr:hypothetical protein [Gammaproteobacteria bacterium]